MNRGAVAEINLGAISNNLKVIKNLSKNSPVIAVVKADAYGHGAIDVSRRLVDDGVEYLAVAFAEEAKELRNAGINSPILVLFDPDINDIFTYNLIPVIRDKKTAAALSKEAEKNNRSISVHIKIDTGMGRLGFTGDAASEISEIANLKGIIIDGVMSHFSEADLLDTSFAKMQIERFNSIKTELLNIGLPRSHNVRLFHIANSAAIMTLPESHFDAVRPGIMLYGYSPVQQSTKTPELIPAMTVKTKILALRRLPSGTPISYGRTFITKRDSLIGVIPVGYADGFSRRFSNNAELLVRGKRVPVIGRVCMDLTMLDLTDIEQVEEGDEVVIIGRQGNESIDAAELAFRADTIPYEILTSLGNMAKRVYNI
ncbi:alanine racemase [Dissulfurispira sp.]|uniref:alanine racemase n=1 Tax=Dissulfurispira sp. TaxID=2817609 RepID=UPI002FD93DF6